MVLVQLRLAVIGPADGVVPRANRLGEDRIAEGAGEDDGLIAGGRPVGRIVEARRAAVVRVGHPELLGAGVHHLVVPRVVAVAEVLAERRCGIVVRAEQRRVEEDPARVVVARDQVVLVGLHVVRGGRDGHGVPHVARLGGEESGHHLRQRRDRALVGLAVREDDLVPVDVERNPGGGGEARLVRDRLRAGLILRRGQPLDLRDGRDRSGRSGLRRSGDGLRRRLLAGTGCRDRLRRAAGAGGRVVTAAGQQLRREGDQPDHEDGEQQHVQRADRGLLLAPPIARARPRPRRRIELEVEVEAAVGIGGAAARGGLGTRRRSIAPRRARPGWQLVIHWHQSYRRCRRSSPLRSCAG